MDTYSTRSLALIENAITDFGTTEQKVTWEGWVSTHQGLNDLDGAPLAVRHFVLEALKKRGLFMRAQLRSPFMCEAERMHLTAMISSVDALAEKLSKKVVLDY